MTTPPARPPHQVAAFDQFDTELRHRTLTWLREALAAVDAPPPNEAAEAWALLGMKGGTTALMQMLHEHGLLR